MRIKSLLLADGIITQPDNKVVIVGAGVDRIAAHQFPWSQAQLSVFVSMEAQGEPDRVGTEHDLRIRVLSPASDVVAELGGPFTVSSSFPQEESGEFLQNAGLVFQQIQFPEPGVYHVEVVVDEDERESVALNLVAGPPPETGWTRIASANPVES